ncbi:3-hydroxybutyrate dehydrogenase [Tamaricihabitans halophyticus]|uniref:3-hydroxybutyrate dehydrogenase n=1 Tax=Tamaricihabitans halophyticus TaxID=1262583 RepID=A0A4R2QUM4_9PSEU|nr:SDR family oxidoreductase [Tamaricihabitans halophyticus]TCP52954.1 3-hydroxybutyrate dehydrogenase [Tamaricihabitans halophyticus]
MTRIPSTVDLSGRRALITGGASGIGRACANWLASAGAVVHIVDRDAPNTTAAATELGGHAHIADLADPDCFADLPAEIDVLVNNAGLQHLAPVHEFPPDRFLLLQRVLVIAPFLLIQRCLPHMYAAGWGRIVNISSVHGLRASAYKAGYVTAKHGLEGLNKVTALEAAPHGVTSNCVNPGYVRTALVEGQIAEQAASHGIPAEDVAEQVLLHRSAVKSLIEPEQVADLVGWLCGPWAAHITGASLAMDGGWSAN